MSRLHECAGHLIRLDQVVSVGPYTDHNQFEVLTTGGGMLFCMSHADPKELRHARELLINALKEMARDKVWGKT